MKNWQFKHSIITFNDRTTIHTGKEKCLVALETHVSNAPIDDDDDNDDDDNGESNGNDNNDNDEVVMVAMTVMTKMLIWNGFRFALSLHFRGTYPQSRLLEPIKSRLPP